MPSCYRGGMASPKFAVNKRAARRIAAGHPWVFANELDVPARELPVGGTVDITAPDGRFLGRGYANPKALIAVRICTRDKGQHLHLPGFWAARIREAIAWRAQIYPGSVDHRLIHGEADGIPGLYLDRFGDVVSAHVTTLGIEQRLPVILEALRDALPELTSGVLRNDDHARTLEGLPTGRGTWFGDPPEHVEISEGGVRFRVAPLGGQHSGHAFRQRANRAFAASLAKGRSVLDVYAGSGAWGLHALRAGAESVMFIDKNLEACEATEANVALNGFEGQVDILKDEARRALIAMVGQGDRFGMVILDPPPFAKSKKASSSALKGYREINAVAMQLILPGGLLFTTSRSQHIFEDRFLGVIHEAAKGTGKRLKLIRRGDPSADHPLPSGMPELRGLKCLGFQVLPEV